MRAHVKREKYISVFNPGHLLPGQTERIKNIHHTSLYIFFLLDSYGVLNGVLNRVRIHKNIRLLCPLLLSSAFSVRLQGLSSYRTALCWWSEAYRSSTWSWRSASIIGRVPSRAGVVSCRCSKVILVLPSTKSHAEWGNSRKMIQSRKCDYVFKICPRMA